MIYPESLHIAIAVHGRFHAFDLAREFLKRGHTVTLFTHYPKWIVQRFGIPPEHVRSLLWHGLFSRGAWRLRARGWAGYPEAWLHERFGRWVASQLKRGTWDVAICWSGIGEEAFRALEGTATLRICQRGSAHIRTQARLLQEEAERTGSVQDAPGPWIIDREEREYEAADMVLTPSSFARQSFLDHGIPDEKIAMVPLAVDTQAFRPSPEVIEARRQRILAGEPVRVLNTGAFSWRKGAWDFRECIDRLSRDTYHFRFVGPIAPACQSVVRQLSDDATFIPALPQDQLPNHYAWGDVFWLPTIEDGYGMVLSQATASGLPVLTTCNSAGTDLVRHGETGWVLPIRTPDAFIDRLRWCNDHRVELADMVEHLHQTFQPRDWADVAVDIEQVCLEHLR